MRSLIALLLCTLCCGSVTARNRPNIILVFIDDMGWADFSCFGNKDADTANIDPKFDGEALPEVVLGKSNASRRKPLFFRRPPDRNASYGDKDLPDLAMREGKWKLLCEYDGSIAELHDLSQDPSEAHNVAADHSDLVRKMTKALLAWHASMPPDKGATYVPVKGTKASSRK